jgi:hypothetical protein
MRTAGKLVWVALLASACGKEAAPAKVVPEGVPPPSWVTRVELSRSKLCGVGIAGAGYDDHSPYPKRLSQERAIRNLAGVLGTSVQEAIIDKSTNHRQEIEMARALHVDEALIQKVTELAETNYWPDRDGTGPFAQKNFMYACTCIDTSKAAATFKVDPDTLVSTATKKPVKPGKKPSWLKRGGKQADGRICAVGFSLPMFFADKTFEGVVEDVRGQLAEVIETLVSSYYEELTNDKQAATEAMTVATTQALAKGVIVTDFWYDDSGIGPNKKQRSTYGFGCVYPMDIIETSLAAVEEKLPEAQDKIARVRAEIDKRAPEAPSDDTPTAPAPDPATRTSPSSETTPSAVAP